MAKQEWEVSSMHHEISAIEQQINSNQQLAAYLTAGYSIVDISYTVPVPGTCWRHITLKRLKAEQGKIK